jgi:hypothetical protein
MTGEKVNLKEAEATASPGERKNQRSSIEFPYFDLDAAVETAKGMFGRAGLGSCEMDEIAAAMNQTVSGSFRVKVAAAKLFGLIDKDGRSGYRLTDLGQEIVQAETEPQARAKAFLTVPLYKAVYENYRGKTLPPAKALEREMITLGVAPKQGDKARQIFERSAREAGFTAAGENRLVPPRFDRVTTRNENPPPPPPPKPNGNGGDGTGHDGDEPKPLKYQLIDLLDPSTMTKAEQDAVYLLINYLARGKKPAPDKAEAAQDPMS